MNFICAGTEAIDPSEYVSSLKPLRYLYAIAAVTMLAEMLKQRIGSNINYANLASDLHVNPGSVKNWLEILENI